MHYLGQHFLKNKNIVKKIADLATLNKNDTVLEIGPGKGVLTEELLKQAGKVVAVEKDKRLCESLNNKFSDKIKKGKLVLIEGDILKIFNFQPRRGGTIFNEFLKNKTKKLKLPKNYKIVANIPYYITSRFLKLFLEEAEIQPEKMVLMVQKEVAERICETPPKSLLAISAQVFGEPKIAFKVSAENFTPPPKVDSAVLIIDNISKKLFNDIIETDFFRIAKTGFAKKRKLLINNLSGGLKISKTEIENIFKKCGIGLKTRAEELDLENWRCLTKNLI